MLGCLPSVTLYILNSWADNLPNKARCGATCFNNDTFAGSTFSLPLVAAFVIHFECFETGGCYA